MRFQFVCIAAAAVIVTSPLTAQSQQEQSETIKFELDDGHIFVDGYVNGEGPFRFGFDTGASGIGRADAALTRQLDLPHVGAGENSDGVRTTQTDIVAVERLRVGNLEKTDVRVYSRDYNRGRRGDARPIQGIIAREFFADKLVTIDYPARTIRFSSASLDPADKGVVPYGESFAIEVCFADGCHAGKLDTGSSRGLVVPEAIVAALPTAAPVEIGRVRRTNSDAVLYETNVAGPVTVAGVTVNSAKLLYTVPSADTINVGSDFLKDYVLTIDPVNRLLKISHPQQ